MFPIFKNAACRCARRTYIKGIGEAAYRGDLDLLELREMPDEVVIEKLSSPARHWSLDSRDASDFFTMPAGCRELGRFGHTTRHDEFVWIKKAF